MIRLSQTPWSRSFCVDALDGDLGASPSLLEYKVALQLLVSPPLEDLSEYSYLRSLGGWTAYSVSFVEMRPLTTLRSLFSPMVS